MQRAEFAAFDLPYGRGVGKVKVYTFSYTLRRLIKINAIISFIYKYPERTLPQTCWRSSLFNRWLGQQPFRHHVVCAGNHDKYFESDPGTARGLLTKAHYLENSRSKFVRISTRIESKYSIVDLSAHVTASLYLDGVDFGTI